MRENEFRTFPSRNVEILDSGDSPRKLVLAALHRGGLIEVGAGLDDDLRVVSAFLRRHIIEIDTSVDDEQRIGFLENFLRYCHTIQKLLQDRSELPVFAHKINDSFA